MHLEYHRGSLPPGLTLSTSGNISGSTTAGGTFGFTVQATDQLGVTAQRALSIRAASANATTLLTEAAQFLNTTTRGAFYEPALKVIGPTYNYQSILRFNLASLNTNNQFVRARLLLTGQEVTNIVPLLKVALTTDANDGALNFDGSGQRVEIADSTTTPLDGMQKLSVSLWVKLNAADTNNHAILAKRTTSSTSTTSYLISLTTAQKVSVSVANKTAVTSDAVLAEGQWYLVVMIFDGSLATNNLQLFINGSPEKNGTIRPETVSRASSRL